LLGFVRFQIAGAEKSFTVQAKSAKDKMEWLVALTDAISK
jgi:hypothetical protein